MKKLTVLLSAPLLLAAAAWAGPAENFVKWDLNKDGLLQKEEYFAMWKSWNKSEAETVASFKGKDKDGNGSITLEELVGAPQSAPASQAAAAEAKAGPAAEAKAEPAAAPAPAETPAKTSAQSAADPAEIEKTVASLTPLLEIGPVAVADYRDKEGQKISELRFATKQDPKMAFEGTLRVTAELTGDDGQVWFGRIVRKQGKKPEDYIGVNDWQIAVPHQALKFPQLAYVIEYGFETNNTFVPVVVRGKKAENADEIMARNKGSTNKFKLSAKQQSQKIDE